MKHFEHRLFRQISAVLLMLCVLAVMPAWSAPVVGQASLSEVFASFPSTPQGDAARVRLLSGNEEAWYARWHLIESAKKTLTITYFIVDQDIFGFSFLGLLRKKARQGVTIRLMVDDRFMRSAKKLKDYDELEELAREPNVEIKIYNPIGRQLLPALGDLRKVFASNHDKIIIADSRVCLRRA